MPKIVKKTNFWNFTFFGDTFLLNFWASRCQISFILKQLKALIVFQKVLSGFLQWLTLSVKKIDSKCQKNGPARGPPNPAEGRPRVEGEGECFAPFFHKILNFYLLESFLGWHMINFWKVAKIIKISIFWHFWVTHFLSGPGLPVAQLTSYWASSKL